MTISQQIVQIFSQIFMRLLKFALDKRKHIFENLSLFVLDKTIGNQNIQAIKFKLDKTLIPFHRISGASKLLGQTELVVRRFFNIRLFQHKTAFTIANF